MTIMDLIRKKVQLLGRYGNYGAWTIALVGLLGSLYLSDIVGWVPCTLCWYSRILMYPIVVIGAVGILRKDHNWSLYALPLSIGGVVLSLYHSLLQWGIIPEAIAPCRHFGRRLHRQYLERRNPAHLVARDILRRIPPRPIRPSWSVVTAIRPEPARFKSLSSAIISARHAAPQLL